RFLVILLSLAAFSLPASADHPNIVFILVDDMGYGDLKVYNSESKIKTPHLDELGAEGMTFLDAHAAGPLCHVSRYGLMTGTYPFRTDVSVWPKQSVIKENEDTVGKLLQRNGYTTAMVGKWHLGFDESGYENPLPGGPVHRGFDTYFGIRASTDIPPYFYIKGDKAVMPPTLEIEARNTEGWTDIQGEFWRAGGISPDLKLHEVLPRFSDEAIEVVKNHDGENPLFLYLAYPAPHTPWLPTEQFVGKSGAGMYGDFMMMVDDEIGRVLDSLEEAEMKEDTLVLFSSDNGPVWFEQDVEKFDHRSVGPLRGIKAGAWEGGHRVPFLARWPGVVESGSKSEDLVSFVDVISTFAEIVGEELPAGSGKDSFSFLSSLKGESRDPRPPLVVAGGRKVTSIRSGNWKYLNGRGSGGFSERYAKKSAKEGPPVQLFDLSEDIGETTNLEAEYPEVVERLDAELERILSSEETR
ncbi:MAG: arylsulfatase, partial [Verrucomicrobiota bacterium]